MSTSTRALELLGLLQSRRHWSGAELADRLGVSQRTLRRDVDGLQELGYPITTTRGTGGGYQLSPGRSLPPLVLGEDEAAAVVMGLKEIATDAHPVSGDAAISAMAKVVQVLPGRIRSRIDSLRTIAMPRPESRRTAIPDVAILTAVALACRDHEVLSFAYRARTGAATERTVHPHRTVNVDARLHLLAWDLGRGDWRTFRIDRISAPVRRGKTFAPRELPRPDLVEYVREQMQALPAPFPVRATVEAPAERVRREVGRYGTVTPIDDTTSEVVIHASSLDWATFCLAATEAPFIVHEPAEAVDYIRQCGERLLAATERPAEAARRSIDS